MAVSIENLPDFISRLNTISEIEENYYPKSINEITIPSSKKPKVIKELERVGISKPTLFPEIDHVASSLKESI